MTPEELDERLRALSEHERAYRAGMEPASDPRPHVMVDGVPVVVSRFQDASLVPAGDIPPHALTSPYVRVKRHSRFRDYPLHMHDFVELSYMYDGRCLEIVNDGVYAVTKGQILLVDSDTIHTIAPLSEDDILVNVQIDKRYFDSNFFSRLDTASVVSSFFVRAISKGTAHDSFILFRSEKSRRIPLFMNELLAECLDPSPRAEEMVRALLALVFAELVNVYERDAEASSAGDAPVLSVLRYIERNYQDATLAAAARELGMSTSYITKLLKRECGKTFKELLQEQRIAVAKRLIAADVLSITDAAAQVGYQNMSYFYKVFERSCGMLPGEWREEAHKGAASPHRAET